MPDEARLLFALVLPFLAALILTPGAMRAARRMAFYDHPVGYKGHAAPTPYLGGVAVIAAVLGGGGAFAIGADAFWPIAACAIVLTILGTVDDRIAVPPAYRVAAEIGAAVLLWSLGHGWSLFDSDAANLGITVLWVVGVVNAFNLMDNMDGAAATVGSVSALGVGAALALTGDIALGALAISVGGACLGFLPFNLRGGAGARIFLGDGGSMPLGFLVAGTLMAGSLGDELGWSGLLAATLLVALPIFDTGLVVVSRARRRVALFLGGRDHLTHRIKTSLGSARRVAVTLAAIQGGFCLATVVAIETGRTAVLSLWSVSAVLALVGVATLEAPTRRSTDQTATAGR